MSEQKQQSPQGQMSNRDTSNYGYDQASVNSQQMQMQQLQKIRQELIARGPDGYIEIPIMASTSLDGVICETRGQRTAMQRRRKEISANLGLSIEPSWMAKQSLGRGFTFGLNLSPVLILLQASNANFGQKYMRRMTELMRSSVLPALTSEVSSQIFQEAINEAKELLKTRKKNSNEKPSELVNEALLEILERRPVFRAAAADFSKRMVEVAASVSGLTRMTGHIVRIDDDEALLAIDRGDDIEFRSVEKDSIEPFGLDEEGQGFVLLEQSLGLRQVSFFVPAVPQSLLSEEEVAERNKRVDEHIKTLDDLKVEVY